MQQKRQRRDVRGGLVAVAAFLCLSCAAASGEKGGLVPVSVPREQLVRAHQPRRLALLVGVQQFQDPQWRPLRYPEADAQGLADVLRDPQLGAFDDVEVIGSATDRAGLRAALARLGDKSRDEQDTVVLYLSSHGTLARDAAGQLRRYLVLADTRMSDVAGTALSMDELKAAFDRLRSRRKVLVLAACHSGGGKSLLPDEVQHELQGVKAGFFVRPIEEVSRASVVLAASDWGETAREDEHLGHDIYTHFFIEALRLGADRNGDGAITASEAHDYARRMTYEYTGGRQRPSAETSEVGVDPIVLVGKVTRAGKPELYSYATALDGFEVRVDGRPLAELPGGVALDPGRYRVQVAKGGGPSLLDERLSLGSGQRFDLADLMTRAEGRWEVGPRVALLSFLDGGSRRAVLGPTVGFGAAASLRDWPSRDVTVRVDAVSSFGRGTLRLPGGAAGFDYSLVNGGAALAWRAQPAWLGGATLLGGPRLSVLWIDRRFGLDLVAAPQRYLTFTPGMLLGASVPLGRGLTLGAELHADWAVVKVDGADRSSGFGELLVGLGWKLR
ncbi:MAG TPA: caspase family protein [Anaeromyxobacteraceae bacterium]|nr:caspase family protein [Anaeromyxobacteraceae bacterium]